MASTSIMHHATRTTISVVVVVTFVVMLLASGCFTRAPRPLVQRPLTQDEQTAAVAAVLETLQRFIPSDKSLVGLRIQVESTVIPWQGDRSLESGMCRDGIRSDPLFKRFWPAIEAESHTSLVFNCESFITADALTAQGIRPTCVDIGEKTHIDWEAGILVGICPPVFLPDGSRGLVVVWLQNHFLDGNIWAVELKPDKEHGWVVDPDAVLPFVVF